MINIEKKDHLIDNLKLLADVLEKFHGSILDLGIVLKEETDAVANHEIASLEGFIQRKTKINQDFSRQQRSLFRISSDVFSSDSIQSQTAILSQIRGLSRNPNADFQSDSDDTENQLSHESLNLPQIKQIFLSLIDDWEKREDSNKETIAAFKDLPPKIDLVITAFSALKPKIELNRFIVEKLLHYHTQSYKFWQQVADENAALYNPRGHKLKNGVLSQMLVKV